MTALPPLAPLPEVLDFLATRRSRPAKTLRAPGPDDAALADLLTLAARSPDHGKLEPWRFVVLGPRARADLSGLTARIGAAQDRDPDRIAKARAMFDTAPSMVAVVVSPVDSAKIPRAEQTLSAGAVCQTLLTAALASGWGANWLSGWMAHDTDWLAGAGMAPGEWIAGLMVLGTEGAVPPERPRPDMAAKTDWRA